MLAKTVRTIFAVGIVLSTLLTACQTPNPEPAPSNEAQPAILPTAEPLPTATAVPPRALVVCLGQEPGSLFSYKSSSRATWTVLEAIYDGPFDQLQDGLKPVILQKLPTIADGDMQIMPVDVTAGTEVLNVDGELVPLTVGTVVYPSGCSSLNCAVRWDGTSPLQMDQMSVAFNLLPDLKWSDGMPLTAADSVYSYQLASDREIPVSKNLVYRTLSYEATDDLGVRWVGKPGFLSDNVGELFWMPMPEHAWKEMSVAQLLESDMTNKAPLGWGAYQIVEWAAGDHILLEKNPNYFRSSEGLPKFDQLVFRFLGEPADNNLAALLTGECDIVDQTSLLEEQLEPILELQRDNKLKAYIAQGPEWEQINFGIKPASYDNGYSAYDGDRPDFFNDLRMRQAFAYCMDRSGLINKPLENQTSIPVGFYPAGNLFYYDAQPLPFDIEAGKKLLDEVGWKDTDGDPNTPLVAISIPGISDNTPLVVNYITTQAPLRVEYARRLSESLTQCGVQLNVQYLNPGELYAPGPEGPVFGRSFDLAQFGWEAGSQSPCWLYQSDEIPSQKNNWIGVNITGYINPDYDAACLDARAASPLQSDYVDKQLAVQKLFAQDLPTIPLYFRLKMAVSRPDFCGLQLDVRARSLLWNLETLDVNSNCQ